MFNRKTSRNDIDYVLQHIDGTNIDKMKLKELFHEYKRIYEKLIDDYLAPKIDFDKFLSNLMLLINELKSRDSKKIDWNAKIENKLPKIIAHVFALWTLMCSSNFFNFSKNEYLFQPHPVQVIAIFRLLGLGYTHGFKKVLINTSKNIFGYDEGTSLRNNLIEIGTGEGKSVTLAVTAVIFSLLGFNVYCVCYSEYLSGRDYQAFKSLFLKLNLTKHIHYGTFSKICEDAINLKGDVRTTINKMISEDDQLLNHDSAKTIETPRILLVDEVDVFFTKDFYGNSYNPITKLTDETIKDLIQNIWNEKNENLTINKVKSFKSYNQCINRFKIWSELIEEAVKSMILALKTFKNHQYCIKNDKIGYKYQDDINTNTSYGYNTLFAYIYENENGNISYQSMLESLGILIRIGSFSYAEIPLKHFNSIIGVTGTLKSTSKVQAKIIAETFQIKYNTYMPSVYPRSNKIDFDETKDVLIDDEANHYKVITEEIKKKVRPPKPTAVFVVFESIKELNKFYNSNEFEPLRLQAHALTEEANSSERKNLIDGSTIAGKITLFTRSFGRGTDFIVHDESVSINGGVHVIQTFLSEEYPEELQIRGKTFSVLYV